MIVIQCSLLSYSNANSKQIEDGVRDLFQKRQDLIKKYGAEVDLNSLDQGLENLSKDYQELKKAADGTLVFLKRSINDAVVSAKVNIRQAFIHCLSLMKNLECDITLELEVVMGNPRNSAIRNFVWKTY